MRKWKKGQAIGALVLGGICLTAGPGVGVSKAGLVVYSKMFGMAETAVEGPVYISVGNLLVSTQEPDPTAIQSQNNLKQLGLAINVTVHMGGDGSTLIGPKNVTPNGYSAFIEQTASGETKVFKLSINPGQPATPILLPAIIRSRLAVSTGRNDGDEIAYVYQEPAGLADVRVTGSPAGGTTTVFAANPAKIIHRDIAARNLLVAARIDDVATGASELVVKDFETGNSVLTIDASMFRVTGGPSLSNTHVVTSGFTLAGDAAVLVAPTTMTGAPLLIQASNFVSYSDPGINTRGEIVTLGTDATGAKSLLYSPGFRAGVPFSPTSWQTLISTGDPLAGSTLTSILWDDGGIGENGAAAFYGTLADGRSGLFVAVVPEVGTGGICGGLATGGLLLRRRQPKKQSLPRLN